LRKTNQLIKLVLNYKIKIKIDKIRIFSKVIKTILINTIIIKSMIIIIYLMEASSIIHTNNNKKTQ
jgi:hypothetical protein